MGLSTNQGGGGSGIDAVARAQAAAALIAAQQDTGEAGEAIPAGEGFSAAGRQWLNTTTGPLTISATPDPPTAASLAADGFVDVTEASTNNRINAGGSDAVTAIAAAGLVAAAGAETFLVYNATDPGLYFPVMDPVSSGYIWEREPFGDGDTSGNGGSIDVDAAIAAGSTNPVENQAIHAALQLLAPLDSPSLTGTPLTPTAAAGTSTTQVASTAFVSDAISTAITNLIDSSPATLNSLNELAAALGDDPNFAVTIAGELTEIRTALGIADNQTNFATFTWHILSDNATAATLFQELESATALGLEVWQANQPIQQNSFRYRSAAGQVHIIQRTAATSPTAADWASDSTNWQTVYVQPITAASDPNPVTDNEAAGHVPLWSTRVNSVTGIVWRFFGDFGGGNTNGDWRKENAATSQSINHSTSGPLTLDAAEAQVFHVNYTDDVTDVAIANLQDIEEVKLWLKLGAAGKTITFDGGTHSWTLPDGTAVARPTAVGDRILYVISYDPDSTRNDIATDGIIRNTGGSP